MFVVLLEGKYRNKVLDEIIHDVYRSESFSILVACEAAKVSDKAARVMELLIL